MEFRLIYQGPLKAASKRDNRVKEKHIIRKQLHHQLAALWSSHPTLVNMSTYVRETASLMVTTDPFSVTPPPPKGVRMSDAMLRGGMGDPGSTYLETLANDFIRSGGFRFAPLVVQRLDLFCSLDILFLRRENPGDLLSQSGDLDNRLKTLLDALRVPKDGSEINAKPSHEEDPFYCLLEDDSLVSEIHITTDRLFTPVRDGEAKNDVVLIIQVQVGVAKLTLDNMSLIT